MTTAAADQFGNRLNLYRGMCRQIMPDDLHALYDQSYVDKFERIHAAGVRLDRLVARVPLTPHDEVVDFACGSGLLMPFVAPRVLTYSGVDFSEPFITAAEVRRNRLGIANAQFACASIPEFCKAHRGQFRLGFALDLSEHVPDAEWVAMLRSMRSALVPRGRLYLHTPNATFFLEQLKHRNLIFRQFPEHVAVRTMDQNLALIREAGFQIARAEFIPHYNILRILHPLALLPLVGPWFQARLFIEVVVPGT